MDITKHVKNINEQGYTLVENVLSPADLKKIQIRFEELIEQYHSDFDSSLIPEHEMGVIRCMVNRGNCFEKLFYVEDVMAINKAILGDCILYSMNGFYTSKKFKHPASIFHTDIPIWTDVVLRINNFYLIDDVTSENGATWVVPGSHLLPDRPSDDFINKHKIQVNGKAGSVLIMQSKLYHAAGINYTDSHRKCIGDVMQRSFIKPQFNWQKIIPTETAARLDEKTKRLFDFYTSPPNSVEEYNREGIRRREENKAKGY